MRTVVSSAEVCHLWAHRAQEHARNSTGSLYFRDNIIYSYGRHFPIAAHVANEDGQFAILRTSECYSVTTAKHKSIVWSACWHIEPQWEVPLRFLYDKNCLETSDRTPYFPKITRLTPAGSAFCVAHFRTLLAAGIEGAARGWKKYRDGKLAQACIHAERGNAFRTFFGVDCEPLTAPLSVEECKAVMQQLTAERREQQQREQDEVRQRMQVRLAEWLRGESAVYRAGTAYLRISADGTRVETSMGAECPIDHAQRALAFVRALAGREYHHTNHAVPLGVFRLDHVYADGSIGAGCHHIDADEVRRFGTILDQTKGETE